MLTYNTHIHTTEAYLYYKLTNEPKASVELIIHLVSIPEISSLYLASVAAQAGLSLPWSQTPKTCFLVTRLISLLIIMLVIRGTGYTRDQSIHT